MSRIRPKWLRDVQVGQEYVTYMGKKYLYTVTPLALANTDDGRKLPLHVSYWKREHLFISEAIPENYRQFVLRHELREFKSLDGQAGRCRLSLVLELSEIPWDIYPEYLAFRRQFFSDLITFYSADPPDFMEELGDSFSFLEELLALPIPRLMSLANSSPEAFADLSRPRPSQAIASVEQSLQFSHASIIRYQAAAENLGFIPQICYYPACGVDSSPAQAFPFAQVIHVDFNVSAVEAHLRAEHEAYALRVEDFQLRQLADLNFFINPSMAPEIPLRQLRKGGYVFCNDYHGTATTLWDDPEYLFLGVMEKTEEGYEFINSELSLYQETVDSEESFQEAPFSFSLDHVFYMSAKNIVERILGKDFGIFTEYARLYRLACEEQNTKTPMVRHGYNTTFLNGFPRKRGSADHLFIFRKRS